MMETRMTRVWQIKTDRSVSIRFICVSIIGLAKSLIVVCLKSPDSNVISGCRKDRQVTQSRTYGNTHKYEAGYQKKINWWWPVCFFYTRIKNKLPGQWQAS